MSKKFTTIDGNEAVARVAYKINEIISIYPITPSSPMAELSDIYSSKGEKNIFGTTPLVIEMQSEGGASATAHGSIQAGALTTTFTASQGLLLMIPTMYKIAGELTPTVFNVASRSLAAQALSIFGDHQDVMAVRQTGFALLSSNSVQEAHDFTLIAQASTLKARVPFVHFFDGFRTSHEVNKIELIDEEIMKKMIDMEFVRAHRDRALKPENPFIRGTSQNPDVYFQGRETVNPYYQKVPSIVQEYMDRFAKLTGREYKVYEYHGAKDAQKVIVLMGSAAEATEETVEHLVGQGEKVGVLKVRLFSPFDAKLFINSLPKTVQKIAVLDRTKEPGAIGEPLYMSVITAFSEMNEMGELDFKMPKIVGGRYGLSSKEFTPAMIKAIFDELEKDKPKNHFTIGIYDDVTNSSIPWDDNFKLDDKETFKAVFFGLGSDGTVGANKNSIKIIGTGTNHYAQGYFVYDSKKAGSITTSFLRFGPKPIKSTYLIKEADFVACHQAIFLDKFEILKYAKKGATFLLNTSYGVDEAWDKLPKKVQEEILEKELKVYIIDGYSVAKKSGMGRRINTVMQTCFFAISGILPKDEAIGKIKETILKTYGKKGEKIVQMNFKAVDDTLANLYELKVPDKITSDIPLQSVIKGDDMPEFVQQITRKLIEGKGDELPVSAIPADGTWPSGTSKYEKRNIGLEVPVWDPDSCIQCNECVFVCPHSVIRSKIVDESDLENIPESFKTAKAKGKSFGDNKRFTIQVSVEDCTGCSLCVEVCPAKNKADPSLKAINMQEQLPLREEGAKNWDIFLKLPEFDRSKLNHSKMKESQLLEPLFEFSGACPGCGETPYIKLASQLFGDRMLVANATGCSSIYGGNLPTTPWTKNKNGRGPAWINSLFEDNAEFGLGLRLTIDKHQEQARELLKKMADKLDGDLVAEILNAKQVSEEEINAQRDRVERVKKVLKKADNKEAKALLGLADNLVKKSVWIIGGDGWAYDIGYGGLDHVLASGKNVNILVLDTQVYSNTGGQQSKATPTGAAVKFAANGKAAMPKDLALMAIAYENVYVARVAMGANNKQVVKAFIEAEQYEGTSIIIAYSHCVAHGYDLRYGMNHQKLAVDCGLWPIFRYNPTLLKEGKNPMTLDYKGPKIPVKDFMYSETRFKMVEKISPEFAKEYLKTAQYHAEQMYRKYQAIAETKYIKEV